LDAKSEVSYNKGRLDKVGYFRDLMASNEEIHDSASAADEYTRIPPYPGVRGLRMN
jgi:hypothetical protein